jgi:hypothetical protein
LGAIEKPNNVHTQEGSDEWNVAGVEREALTELKDRDIGVEIGEDDLIWP